jgi:zinc transport system ATP-binding protein
MTHAVELEKVDYCYQQVPVLEDLNLTISSGEFMALIGPNGGGKSTLIKLILGLIRPDRGEIRVFGRKPDAARDLVGYLPQQVYFDPQFPINVFDTVLTGRYHGLAHGNTTEDVKAVEKALEDVGMLKFRDRQIGRLSGGQRQRVFIARAIVRQPQLLLLDEPMASIDPQMQESFYHLLNQLKGKMTIVLVSHDVGAVSSQADYVACLNQKLFYHGPAEGAAPALEEAYQCPVDLISHGIPHRVLREHQEEEEGEE